MFLLLIYYTHFPDDICKIGTHTRTKEENVGGEFTQTRRQESTTDTKTVLHLRDSVTGVGRKVVRRVRGSTVFTTYDFRV